MPNVKVLLSRYRRYAKYLIQYFLLEKPRGLDFSMRDKSLIAKSNGKYFGYSKTDEAHLNEIFRNLSYEECQNFMDIGCGKGVVLKEAAKYPFRRIAGIELIEDIYEVAQKNLRILKLTDRVECVQGDATTFSDYGSFDTFFLYNPFSEEILQKVLNRIVESRNEQNKTATIVYHDPRFLFRLEQLPGYLLEKRLYDSLRNYETCICRIGE